MPTATITSKGQITIPIEVRKKLGLKAGDRINFFEDQEGIFTFEPKTGSIMDMEGILKHLGLPALGYAPTIEEMNQAVLDRASALDRASMSEVDESSADDKVA